MLHQTAVLRTPYHPLYRQWISHKITMLTFAKENRIKPEISMAPLIDMVFLLLLFFAVTGSFVVMQGLNIDLPKTEAAETIGQGKNIVVTVDSNGRLFLNKTMVDPPQLKAQLGQLLEQNAGQSVLIQAEESATAQSLVTVMEIINASGATNVLLQTINK